MQQCVTMGMPSNGRSILFSFPILEEVPAASMMISMIRLYHYLCLIFTKFGHFLYY